MFGGENLALESLKIRGWRRCSWISFIFLWFSDSLKFYLLFSEFNNFLFLLKIVARDELAQDFQMRSKKKRLSSRKLLCWNMRDVLAFVTVVTALLYITARARAHKVNYEFEVRARMIRVNRNSFIFRLIMINYAFKNSPDNSVILKKLFDDSFRTSRDLKSFDLHRYITAN